MFYNGLLPNEIPIMDEFVKEKVNEICDLLNQKEHILKK